MHVHVRTVRINSVLINYMNSVQWSGNVGGATLKVGGCGPPQLLTFPFEHFMIASMTASHLVILRYSHEGPQTFVFFCCIHMYVCMCTMYVCT